MQGSGTDLLKLRWFAQTLQHSLIMTRDTIECRQLLISEWCKWKFVHNGWKLCSHIADFQIILMLLSEHARESQNYAKTLSLLNTHNSNRVPLESMGYWYLQRHVYNNQSTMICLFM